MRKLIIIVLLIILSTPSVLALEYEAPPAPESVEKYVPPDNQTFGEGLWYITKQAIALLSPSLADAGELCLRLFVIVLFVSVLKDYTGISKYAVSLVATVCISLVLVQATNTMVHLGTETITQISDYGKLLLPVMTGALAAQGGISTSAALYTATALFNSVLSSFIAKILVPMLYIYMIFCIGFRAMDEELLKNIRNFLKWLITWSIKISIYLFTGYLSITGVISGTTDASALKAAKLAVSGAIPVVGNIISDASETILVSAGVLKNAAGIYGLFVILSLWIGPFVKIGVQYLILKATSALCSGFGAKESCGLIQDFSGIMGLIVAMTATVCILFFVSIVCCLKGVG